MDMVAEIRRRHLVSKESISSIARDLKLSRPTVRKHCLSQSEPIYHRHKQPTPKLEAFQETLESWLRTERLLPKAQRRTARRLFEGLQAEGYRGAYDSVQRFVRRWKAEKFGPGIAQAFVPLVFSPGEVCQFDWSHEHVELNGVMQTIKLAHFRLTFSRQMFVVAYPRETQEMVFDAHNRAFAFFGGVPERMVYDYVPGNIIVVMCPPRLCGGPPQMRGIAMAVGHILIKGRQAIRGASARSAKLVAGEAPPKKSKEPGMPRGLLVSFGC
jgi:transposase